MSEKSLGEMSRPELLMELNNRAQLLRASQSETLRAQLVAAVRLDTIGVLGLILQGSEPDIKSGLPQVPEVRAIMAHEFNSLAAQCGQKKKEYAAMATRLLSNESEEPPAEA